MVKKIHDEHVRKKETPPTDLVYKARDGPRLKWKSGKRQKVVGLLNNNKNFTFTPWVNGLNLNADYKGQRQECSRPVFKLP